MTDLPTQVLIDAPPSQPMPRLGGPCVVTASSIHGLFSPAEAAPKYRESSRSLSGLALVGLYRSLPITDTHFLVLSWDWSDDNVTPSHHAALLDAHESRPHAVSWFATSSAGAIWRSPTELALLRFRLSQQAMDSLFELEGDPYTEAYWLAQYFLPHRYGGALRIIDPVRIQLWVRLS